VKTCEVLDLTEWLCCLC